MPLCCLRCDPGLTVKGGISTGFRAPDVRTVTPGYAYTTGGSGCASNTPPSCGVILGNEDLEPEETTNIEIGTVHETGAFTFSATAFHTRFKNKLQQVTLQNPDGSPVLWTDGPQYTGADGSLNSCRIYQNFNVDKAKITGLELAGDWDVTPTLSARATYTHTGSRQKSGDFEGFLLARTPEHMASLRLDWVTPVSGLETWLAATYHGSEIASGLHIGEESREITINGFTRRKYSSYTTADLGLSYRVTNTATVNAVVYNALNREIREDEFKTVAKGRLWLGFTADSDCYDCATPGSKFQCRAFPCKTKAAKEPFDQEGSMTRHSKRAKRSRKAKITKCLSIT